MNMPMLTVFAVLVATSLAAGSEPPDDSADRQPRGTTQMTQGKYASVNGLEMYYEIHGAGRPLVLLHGAFGTIESAFGRILPSLAKTRRVIAVELQGHGHTADIERPLTYAQMAEDTASLLRQLQIEEADFFGWSMGGTVALHVAVQHRRLVRKLMIIGSSYGKLEDAFDPEALNAFKNLPPDFAPKELKDPYDKTAPDPKQWPVLVAKVKSMGLEFKGLRSEELQSIKAPTLIMMGDHDGFRLEHAVQMFRLIPSSQLAIFPGADHFMPVHSPDKVLSTMTEFLDESKPEAK